MNTAMVSIRWGEYFGLGIAPAEISFPPCVLVYGDHIERLGQTGKAVGMGRLMLFHKKLLNPFGFQEGWYTSKAPVRGTDEKITINLNKMGKRQAGYALRIGYAAASLRSISLRLR